jgi:hypothetical protein
LEAPTASFCAEGHVVVRLGEILVVLAPRLGEGDLGPLEVDLGLLALERILEGAPHALLGALHGELRRTHVEALFSGGAFQ